MKCGVRFCGGCNPRYDRREAYEKIKNEIKNIDFTHAVENEKYDCLLIIGGCTNCCASYEQFDVKGEVFMIWDQSHVKDVIERLSTI